MCNHQGLNLKPFAAMIPNETDPRFTALDPALQKDLLALLAGGIDNLELAPVLDLACPAMCYRPELPCGAPTPTRD